MGKFQDTTVKKIIGQLNDSFFLPDIQREYVWLNKEQDKKIELLFDSILRDYPIGTFLFWSLKKSDFETSKDEASAAGKLNFQLYKFIERYDVRKSHNEKVNIEQVKSENITIVLDGQQRLTSLYIGLMGSRTLKKPRYWWDNPDAFEEKKLYLNLRHAPQPDNPDDNYQFEFKAPSSLPTPDEKNYWFRVGEILELDSVLGYCRKHGLSDEESIILEKLHNNLCSKDIISFYNEDEKNLDKVLKIFIRVNSGGTQLSYSDLLMSILTANFSSDIRTLMIELVDNLQNSGFGVMGRDQILKTCLLLTGCNHVFKLENFSKTNISKIETNWSRITECILDAASIAEDCGYANNLSSGYILTTIALYLYIKNLRAGKVSVDDRREIWKFIRNAQITAYFSATLDSKLGIAANTMRGNKDLPQVKDFEEFNVRMDKDRNISVHKENVLDMLNLQYGSYAVLPVLQVLYPTLDYKNRSFHIDHIYPKSKFTVKNTKLPAEYLSKKNNIFNLQLLEGGENIEKRAKDPEVWLSQNYDTVDKVKAYKRENYIKEDFTLNWEDIAQFEKDRTEEIKLALEKLFK